ncbi:MAG: HlyD family efflux transporter periplasmic adaptor subunit [Phycisphaeraceae bacterium]|nr:HlyD family efflux transporter periplasmic adaptor subunit [Phycisphaeraceae bacterium]MBX3406527.1 HlyD family efflux transporter periplasmic adaptor subunit [Phycisphaeraceae bacterium]
MIDLSNVRAPGWQQVVAELNSAAPDDRAFLERLLRIVSQVTAARQGALFMPDRADGEEIEPRVELVWPAPGAATVLPDEPGAPKADKAKGVEFPQETHAAARAAFSSGQARAYSLDKQEMYYDGGGSQGCVLAVPIRAPAPAAPGKGAAEQVVSVVTLLIEPRGKDAIRSTLAMAEVLCGYVHGHAARQALRRTQTASFALDLATKLIASINTAPNFKGACLQLVNELSKQFALDRVALGWVKRDAVRARAISDTEHFDRRMAMVGKIEAAMDECLDQEQPIVYPQPAADGPGGDVLLAQSIVHAHRELASGNARLKLCSLPLRIDDDVVGVVLLETASDAPIDLNTIELLQAAMDLVAPVLRLRRSDDRWLAVRAWDSTVHAAAWAVGPKHTVWKVAGIALLAGLIFVTVYHKTYRVGAEAHLEPRVRRIVSAPFDARLKSLVPGIEPGVRVTAGQLLAQFDDTEYRLSLASADAKLQQAEKSAAAARLERDLTKVAAFEAQAKAARAEADAYRDRIERCRVVAPIDGEIIAGDIKERVGATLKLGDPMFQIASMDDIVLVAKVDERDVALVRRAFEDAREQGRPARGAIATKSNPSEPIDFTVERIVPLAQAAEGKNVYEVRAVLDGAPGWFRPGMEGIAKFDTQRHSLLWIGSRRIIDTVRMWWW